MAKPNSSKPRGARQTRPRRTAVRRSRLRPGTRQRHSRPASRIAGVLERRPWALAGIAVSILLVGIVIGLSLRGDEGGQQVAAGADPAEAPAPAAPTPAAPAPMVTYETEYGPPVVPPEPLRPAEPGMGVRPTDPPENQTGAPEVSGAGDEARPEWLRNAVAPPAVGDRPMIAIVIDDMGVDRRRSDKVLTLPGPVTASYLTYARDLEAQVTAARAAGHELLMHVAMEPSSKAVDPGPDVLTTDMAPSQVTAKLTAVLDRIDGYVGINNHMGSRFTASREGMRPVIEVLKARGLLWFDSRTTADSVGAKLAREAGVPYVERNVFLDHEDTPAFVTRQLTQLEHIAREHGYAVAIGHPKDVTIAGLKRWLPTLEEKGFVLVPLSTVVRRRHGTG